MNRQEEYDRKYKEHLRPEYRQVASLTDLIGKDGDYKCGKCKKIWVPTDADINKKAMMTYYKNCGSCRLYLFNKCIEYRNRDR